MSSPYFRFKQFIVWHDHCAMKVGTDGVLLGAWAGSESNSLAKLRILDIGTGSGLVALILAQRFPRSIIDGIDIDASAAKQAKDNFAYSPFNDRLHAYCSSLQKWETKEKYDMIVSNPPYFSNSLLCPNETRTNARHNNMLSFADLLLHSERLLTKNGIVTFILPADAEKEILTQARVMQLYCIRHCCIHTTASKPVKRILISFSRQAPTIPIISERLCLSEAGQVRSAAYSALTKDLYL